VHTLVVTEFEQNVAVVTVFEKVFVFANVVVFERPVNLNLGLQLRSRIMKRGVRMEQMKAEPQVANFAASFRT
jgi:hypothetical protein